MCQCFRLVLNIGLIFYILFWQPPFEQRRHIRIDHQISITILLQFFIANQTLEKMSACHLIIYFRYDQYIGIFHLSVYLPRKKSFNIFSPSERSHFHCPLIISTLRIASTICRNSGGSIESTWSVPIYSS